jgi:hypothetical protein
MGQFYSPSGNRIGHELTRTPATAIATLTEERNEPLIAASVALSGYEIRVQWMWLQIRGTPRAERLDASENTAIGKYDQP